MTFLTHFYFKISTIYLIICSVGIDCLILRSATHLLCGICCEEFSEPWTCRRHLLLQHLYRPCRRFGCSHPHMALAGHKSKGRTSIMGKFIPSITSSRFFGFMFILLITFLQFGFDHSVQQSWEDWNLLGHVHKKANKLSNFATNKLFYLSRRLWWVHNENGQWLFLWPLWKVICKGFCVQEAY